MSDSNVSAVSCFCSPYGLDDNNSLDVLVSISHQLARQWPAFRWALAQELKGRTEVFTIPYLEAVRRLILFPSRRSSHIVCKPIVIVIDGLHIDQSIQPEHSLLEALLEVSVMLPLRVVYTAATGSNLYQWIKYDARQGYLAELCLDSIDGSTSHVGVGPYLEATSNNVQISESLTQHLGSSPIHTVEHTNHATAGHSYRWNRNQLITELGGQGSRDDNSEEYGDALLLALDRCVYKVGETNVDRIVDILACASEPLDFTILRQMTGELNQTMISSLAPIVYLTASQSRVGLSRPAQLILFDHSLSGRFHFDIKRTHSYLAHWCFDYIGKTQLGSRRSVLSAYSDHMERSEEGENLAGQLDGTLVYACANWVRHLRGAEPSESLWLRVSAFLSERLFDWIEVMSRKCLLLHSCRMLREIQQYISSDRSFIEVSSELRVKIFDTCRFEQAENAIYDYRPQDKRLAGHTFWVRSVAYSPDGAYIASGSNENTIRMWDAHTGQQVGHPLTGHTDWVRSVAYSPDGAYIASGSDDKTIRMWDAHTGQQVGHPLTGHTDWVRSVAYSPDGAYIASGSDDKTIRMWDAHTGQQVGHPLTGHTSSVESVAYSPDGAYIASGSLDRTIRMWDAHTGQQVGHPLTGHTSSVWSVAYSPDGAYIASGSEDRTIRMWDAHTGQQVGHPLTGHTDWVRSVAYSPDGAYIASGSDDKTIRMWDAHTGQQVGHPLTGHTDWVRSVAYSPDGAYIASGSDDKTIRMWDAHTGQQVGHPLTGHTSSVESVAYSPDGAYIASGSLDRTIRMWDAHTGQQVGHPLTGHTSSVWSVAYSPDGAYIASGSEDRTIRMWDAHTGQQVGHTLTGHTYSVCSVAYSPDGAYIASGSLDNTIRMWDAHTGQQVGHPLTGHTSSVRSVAYSPDGAYIASGSDDKTIRIWDFTSLHDKPLSIHVLTTVGAIDLCDVDSAGWVLDQDGNRLVHIPPRVRRRFMLYQSEDTVLALDLRGVKLGEAWYENFKVEGEFE
ncbi:hypothetical protein RhiJN_00073 [Ceratobasidium sp. AG-Ba]|nr:hypothetical protein RhiJN_00073 [Ceratobasidium sp. AG-Ba]